MADRPITKTTERVERTYIVHVDRTDIIAYLASHGYVVPPNASITVRVPGGGDWSNEDLHIEDSIVVVRWTQVETKP